ncbi:hypothetical protein Tchl_3113 [Thauera chlorobenzoica]|uniref:Mobile element protein n=1 Tax=Thauera chlorobenzoica TaxID=96773 RepID=A0A1L6FGP2_9RHOO|nr:hypothetical protein Tchl_3113 [Thauera chlorobenzoica]
MPASLHNPGIKAFYQRLHAVGKLPNAALVAGTRKPLSTINTMVRNDTGLPQLPILE